MSGEIAFKILEIIKKGIKCTKKAYDNMDSSKKKKLWKSVGTLFSLGLLTKISNKRNNDNAVNNEHKAVNIDMENMDSEIEKIILQKEKEFSYEDMIKWYDERIDLFEEQMDRNRNLNKDELKAYQNIINKLIKKKETYIKNKK